MNSRLRVGVIGVGYLGRFHAQKYKSIEQAEFVGVSDANAARGQEIAKEIGVPFFDDYRKLLEQVNAVTIAASTTAHYETAREALSRGVHVFVEKPIADTSLRANELVVLAQKKNLKLQVGHVERFNPALREARAFFPSKLDFIECHRLNTFTLRGADVDVVLDLMIHDLDLVLSIVKSDLKSVQATGSSIITSGTDIAHARLEFASGVVAQISASRVNQSAVREFRAYGEGQGVIADLGKGMVHILHPKNKGSRGPLIEIESRTIEKGDALLLEAQSFVRAVLSNETPEVTGADGALALALAEKIAGLIHSGRR